ncbi:hypothetical protein GDO86_017337 [Hymenochirus boettgeri]|uniref:Interleukin-21 receptor n=1 Tax=Hymenochirus boettgeri TaxID=247094 RepID=A0A8T2IS66_9PIPI|nr:hypothetical protein GDO86_017337 [Hymenochirus boettgeri]
MKMSKNFKLALIAILCLLVCITKECEDLRCYVDYIDTLTCKYGTGEKSQPGVSYNLSAIWTTEESETTFCDLIQNEDPQEHTCNMDLEDFGADDIYTISINTSINGENHSSQLCESFYLRKTFVPKAPYNLAVSVSEFYNFSWQTIYSSGLHFQANELAYELSYKKKDESWEKQKCIHILEDEKSVVLLQSSFQDAEDYEARVRTKPKNSSIYQGGWSKWSSSVVWRTKSFEKKNEYIWLLKNWISFFSFVVVIMTVLFCILKLPQRLWKNGCFIIPNPEVYFKPLYMGHNGDFKSWLGSSYATSTLPIEVTVAHAGVLEIYSRNVFEHISKLGIDNTSVQEKLLLSKECNDIHSEGCTKCICSTGTRDRPSQQISIETVTVAGGNTPCCSQCNDIIALFDNSCIADGESSADDGYPVLSFDCDSSNLNHFLDNVQCSEVSINHTRDCTFDLEDNTTRPNLLNLISASQDDENVFYSDEHYDALSPGSGNSEDFGYSMNCLDLDTIDSGFVDSECGSPVDSEFGNHDIPPKMPNMESYSRNEEEWQRNYVKQWVPSSN